MADTPFSTPKRKHAQLLDDHMTDINNTTQFTFDLRTPVKDGSASPRTSVAHRFRGLAIESGGGVVGRAGRASQSPELKPTRPVSSTMQGESLDGARKRVKRPDIELVDADSPQLQLPVATWDGTFAAATFRPEHWGTTDSDINRRSQSPRQKPQRSVKFALDTAVVEQAEAPANIGSNAIAGSPLKPTPQAALPSIEPIPEIYNKPRNRVRAGTPPPRSDISDEPIITDPLRASLTWHDDEITIYDPDDSDDDGTGINGIGFKPTAAIAYERTVKRKQQLAEYRKREEREARAKRSQRRRGSPVPGLVELKGTVERRRVRFMESATELISF
ncbi:hypothetical protein B0T14DRAFT_339938 [Immersiella caudata]|uniref:Uncharacterized protein n=1 Tax=Immersiella caudata TaxID=314043 RepID=A0AA39W4N3_9PEZI|nr:hypothetical protein B0T14DRAFT_339938 [Immersiella caudata]